MWKLIKKVPYWYLIAIPLLATFLGAASNQAVLIANGDKFPVMYNNEKIHQSCQTHDALAATPFIALLLGPQAPKLIEPKPAKDEDLCQNGGKFLDDTHVIMDKDSHLKALADIFDMHDAVYSIGDFVLMLGEWMFDWASIAWLVLVIRKFVE